MSSNCAQGEVGAKLALVKAGISEACSSSGRSADSVTLVAISKKIPFERVLEAANAGQVDFGENYVQAAERRAAELVRHVPRRAFRMHLTGPLQSNKVRKAVGMFDLIHTLDRLDLAQALAEASCERGISQAVLVQVNISGEASKHGVPPAEVAEFYREVSSFVGLTVQGLMAIGSYVDESAPRAERIKDHQALFGLKLELESSGLSVPDLSMGMSHDYRLAIECGATLVRVGTALFDKR